MGISHIHNENHWTSTTTTTTVFLFITRRKTYLRCKVKETVWQALGLHCWATTYPSVNYYFYQSDISGGNVHQLMSVQRPILILCVHRPTTNTRHHDTCTQHTRGYTEHQQQPSLYGYAQSRTSSWRHFLDFSAIANVNRKAIAEAQSEGEGHQLSGWGSPILFVNRMATWVNAISWASEGHLYYL